MDTIDTLRLFSDGRMSVHDTQALMISMGHSQEDFGQALATLVEEAGSNLRVSKYRLDEMQADLFLTASEA